MMAGGREDGTFMRVTREQAAANRERIVAIASTLFRQHGFEGIGVADIMKAAGLTHGGFYGHFSSKEALAAEACARAFDEKRDEYDSAVARSGGDRDTARVEFVKRYTGKSHRDAVGLGCPAAAMCGDVARDAPKSPLRAAFVAGVA